jgi:type II restriction enzyme
MNLSLPTEGLGSYESPSQRARVSSEAWGARELYCPRCSANSLEQLPGNTPVIDFRCENCRAGYQLKSKASKFSGKINDGAHSKMRSAILDEQTPNLLLLQYQSLPLAVRSLIFIPDFSFTLSAVERRKPLPPTARRAGWIGCNILLDRIPIDARISIVRENHPAPPAEVRRAYSRLKPLADFKLEKRGWTLDVLNAVRSLGKTEFDLREIYALENSLKTLHPGNHHIQPKIRQQLQILRDLGLLTFLGGGYYRLT